MSQNAEKIKKFSADLNTLVAKAMQDGCPLDLMILELTLCEHQTYERYSYGVKMAMVQAQAEKDAETAEIVLDMKMPKAAKPNVN